MVLPAWSHHLTPKTDNSPLTHFRWTDSAVGSLPIHTLLNQKLTKRDMTHGIVIPCYNEGSRLDMTTFIQFADRRKDIHLCFVNDGSKDQTRSALAQIKHDAHDNVYVLSTDINEGKAEAVRQGALFLHHETEVDTIGFLDADLSTSFIDYMGLIETYETSEDTQIVFGSRNLDKESNTIERNPIRDMISMFIGMLIRFITRLNIRDTQCGAKVFDRELIPMIYGSSFFSRWLFDVEILLRLKHKIGVERFTAIFREIPLKKWVHMDDSKLGMKDSIMIPLNLMKIWMEYDAKPTLKHWKTGRLAA